MVKGSSERLPGEQLALEANDVDLIRGVVTPRDGSAPRTLTTRERELLLHLVAHQGETVTRDALIAQVWGYSDAVVSRACDNAVARLRAKIEATPGRPSHLLTVHGAGYRLVLAGPAPPAPAGTQPLEGPAPASPQILLGDVSVDLGRQRASTPGGDRPLTAQEIEILRCLWAAGGRVVDRAALTRQVWGRGGGGRALANAVHRLRAKIEVDPSSPRFLLTERSGGHRLAVPPPTTPEVRGRLFGRDAALADLRAALARGRWVLVTGPGGVGKTRLARQVAADVRSFWVDLGAASTGEQVDAAVARALALALTDDDAVAHIGRVLAARGPALLVLDNLEQGVDAVAPRIGAWLGAAPALRVLGTSRVRLGRDEEQVIELGALARADAVALFLARARAASSQLRLLPADDAVLDELVDRLDGLPLAIELAAARVPALGPAELLARLDRRLDLLERPRAEVDRHRSLRAALHGTWELLAPPQIEALLLLTRFREGFSLADVEGLLGDEGVDRLQDLRDHSLVHSRAADAQHERRFGTYEAVAAYADEFRAALPDGGRALDRRWIAWVARLGAPERLATLGFAGRGEEARQQREAVEDLARAAGLALGWGEVALAVPAALGAAWVRRHFGPYLTALSQVQAVLAAGVDEADDRVRLRTAEVDLLRCLDRPAEAEQAARAGWAEAQADAGALAELGALLGANLHDQNRRAEAVPILERAAALGEQAGRPDRAAWLRGRAALIRGQDGAAAIRAFEASVAAAAHTGDWVVAALSLVKLASFDRANGRQQLAWRRLEEARAAFRDAGHLQGQIDTGLPLIVHLALVGEHEPAEAVGEEVRATIERTGSEVDAATLWTYLATSRVIRSALGPAYEAMAAARRHLAGCRDIPRTRGYLELREAEWMLARGDARSALQLVDDAASRFGAIGDRWNLARADAVRARALVAAGRAAEALEAAERAVAALAGRDDSAALTGLAVRGQARAAVGDVAGAAEDLRETRARATSLGFGSPRSEPGVEIALLAARLGSM